MSDTYEYKGYTISITEDDNPKSPREWDNLGTMICSHRRYDLGDTDHPYKHTIRRMLSDYGYVDMQELIDVIQQNEGEIIWLPLYLYDHGNITMYTDNNTTYHQHAAWDSGVVGMIYVSKAQVRKEYGWKHITKERANTILGYLRNEVTTYDQYLTGDVYGYEISKDDDELDSCWGFFGEDYCRQEAESIVDWHVKEETERAQAAVPVTVE